MLQLLLLLQLLQLLLLLWVVLLPVAGPAGRQRLRPRMGR